VTPQNWLDILVRPAANLAAADRLRLFRQGRIAAAFVMVCLFPLLAFVSGEPPAVTASLLLATMLSAVVALNMSRPAELDRAAVFHVVITATVLAGGVLRGLPPSSAIMMVSLAAPWRQRLSASSASRCARRRVSRPGSAQAWSWRHLPCAAP
jgi:hypothetical protein